MCLTGSFAKGHTFISRKTSPLSTRFSLQSHAGEKTNQVRKSNSARKGKEFPK